MIPQPALYLGRVMHLRLRPKRHQFRYRVFSLLLDLDAVDRDFRTLWLARLGLVSFREKDHGPRDGTELRPWAEAELASAGVSRPKRLFMLSFPRVLGYAFNPISVYLAYDENEALSGVIYEVKNTFGDQIAYAQKLSEAALVDHRSEKAMYVSPFIDLDETYRFNLLPPQDRFALRIRQGNAQGQTLIATHNATSRALSDAQLALALITHPLMTLKVTAGIHLEALRLVMKGVTFNRYSKSKIWAEADYSG